MIGHTITVVWIVPPCHILISKMLTGDTVEIVDVDIDVVAVVLPAITVTMTAIVVMIITVSGSKSSGTLPISERAGNTMSVAAEIMARKNRIAVKGLTKASASLRASDLFLPRVTTLRPLSASLCAPGRGCH